MAGNEPICVQEEDCSVVDGLHKRIAELEKEVEYHKPKLRNVCPVCGSGMVFCSSMDGGVLVHNCLNGKFVSIPKKLKEGQRSILINNLVGGCDE